MTATNLIALVLGAALAVFGSMVSINAYGLRRRIATINATRERGGRARTPAGVAVRGGLMVVVGIALVVSAFAA